MGKRHRVLLKSGLLQPRSFIGLNLSGPEFPTNNTNYAWPTNKDWDYFRWLGVTLVRIPIAWENIQPTLSGALDVPYGNLLKRALAQASARGIGVIVDLHNFAHYTAAAQWGSTVFYAGNAGAAGTGVSAFGDGTLTTTVFADIWTKLSGLCRDSPALVGYCLMNEPINIAAPTNLLFAPNGYGDIIGANAWGVVNGCVATQLAAGTNPVDATNYGPAWSLTGGSGFASAVQHQTLANVQYTLSAYAKTASGTQNGFLSLGATNGGVAATTTWQRFSVTATPPAGDTVMQLGVNTAAAVIQYANAQLELGASATTYVPNPYTAYAQAGITAIRAVDPATPIYVNGYHAGVSYRWPWENWDLMALTGGNLIFEAHQYFDGVITQGGGGGTYTGSYASHGFADDTAGAQMVAPFVSWCATTGQKGFLGEFGVPNTKTDSQSWTPLMLKAMSAIQAGGVRGAYWYGGGWTGQDTGSLNIMPAANSNRLALQTAAIASLR